MTSHPTSGCQRGGRCEVTLPGIAGPVVGHCWIWMTMLLECAAILNGEQGSVMSPKHGTTLCVAMNQGINMVRLRELFAPSLRTAAVAESATDRAW